jgi:hypothetical protein
MVARRERREAAHAARLATRCLMVLGAGPAQVPGIVKAVAAGHRVISVDPYPDSPGHALAHDSVRCDTRDVDGVLKAAAALRTDGVCTFRSDVATVTVHRVRERLGLPGGYPHAAEIMSRKDLFREFQCASALPCPKFVHGVDPAPLHRRASCLGPVVFCKPVDNCGSRGITRIDSMSGARLEEAIAHARQWSRTGAVCLEERIPGIEVGGDALFANGEMVFSAITRKCVEALVVRGHRLPCGLDEADTQRVEAALESACALMGYRDGPLNFDAMVDESAVTIIEMSPRNGGNGLTDLIRHARGVDVEQLLIDLALGRRPPRLRPAAGDGFGVVVLGATRAGRLAGLPTLGEWQQLCPNAVEVFYARRPGEHADALAHNGNAIGHVVFRCADAEEFDRTSVQLTRFDLLGP